MNHTQYNKQIFQTMKNQHVQHLNRIKMLETELNKSAAQNNLENIQLKEMLNIEVEKKIQQLDFSNNRINELSAELDAKTAELECSKKKINEILGDLDKKNDAFYNIDKIIFRNNEYFDEIKKELNDKIQHNKEVNELYEKKNHELNAIRMELELAYKELDTTKTELQLYKNDFILKSATF